MSNLEILNKNSHKRTRCVVYTRVMGYHRPVESFNLGKKGEHNERVMFCEESCKSHILNPKDDLSEFKICKKQSA